MQSRWPVADQRECPWTFPRNSSIHPSRHQIRASGRRLSAPLRSSCEIRADPLGLPGGHLVLQMAAKVDSLGRSRSSSSPAWDGRPACERVRAACQPCLLAVPTGAVLAVLVPGLAGGMIRIRAPSEWSRETRASAAPCGEPWCSVSRPPDPQAFLFQSGLSDRSSVE